MKLTHLALILVAISPLRTQQPASLVSPDNAGSSSVAARPPRVPTHALIALWLDLTAFSHAERYRHAFVVGNNFNSAESRSIIAGSLKLDRAARLRIGFRASSGRSRRLRLRLLQSRSRQHPRPHPQPVRLQRRHDLRPQSQRQREKPS